MSTSANNSANAGEGNSSAKNAPAHTKGWDDDENNDEEEDDEQEIGLNYNIKVRQVPSAPVNLSTTPAQATPQRKEEATPSASLSTLQEEPSSEREEFRRDPAADSNTGYSQQQDRKFGQQSSQFSGKRGFGAQEIEGTTPSSSDLQQVGSSYSGQKDTYTGEKFNRGPRGPRPERPTYQDIDPQSNYAKFYEKDPHFFMRILELEEPGEQGHEFKMQLRKNENYVDTVNEELMVFGSQSFDDKIALVLIDYDAENIRTMTHRPGDQQDKHRILFTIKCKEKAIQFWRDFMLNRGKRIQEGCRHTVFLQKPAELFIRYGDIEAEKYYAELERLKQENAKPYENKGGRDNYDRRGAQNRQGGGRQNYGEQDQLEATHSGEYLEGAGENEQYQQKRGFKQYKDNKFAGGPGGDRREGRRDDRRGYDKYQKQNEFTLEQKNLEAFEELKSSSHIQQNEKPHFINSRKLAQKDQPEETLESPIPIMPEVPHRNVIDTSKQVPVRTVTDYASEQQQARYKKQGSQQQYQPKLAHQASGNSDYGVEHVHGGNLKFKRGGHQQQQQHPVEREGQQYNTQPRRGGNKQGGGGRGRGYGNEFRNEDAQLSNDQLAGVLEQPYEGGYSKGGYGGNSTGGYSKNTGYRRDNAGGAIEGNQDYNEEGDKGTGYQGKHYGGVGRGERRQGGGGEKYYQKSSGSSYQQHDDQSTGTGGQQRRQPKEERKGGDNRPPKEEGGFSQSTTGGNKKSHGAVMGPKAGASNIQAGSGAGGKDQKAKKPNEPKSSLGMFGIFSQNNHLV